MGDVQVRNSRCWMRAAVAMTRTTQIGRVSASLRISNLSVVF